ncbi:preprotein translocase subunit YajC [Desulfovibrio litoralis]|uniref:Sec translocon accessory complex subunit YajC n=1 Tax=Desulfovibrio litoralis DSM 11393 TaxID=1121455 RepID=A0A1M7SNC0_9BACT|nr:preprotein translocase subunit YajC [Desulfovibrio litoralis]SHN60002.1 protein translocase subunit yajC [Desulfovibrio litoralis DSM 11393]
MLFVEVASAMGGAGGDAAAQGGLGGFASFVPLILMFAIFYFLIIRPQQKKNKEYKEMQASLKVGDKVITAGGMYGEITEIKGDLAVVDLGNKVVVTVGRAYIAAAPTPKVSKESDKKK